MLATRLKRKKFTGWYATKSAVIEFKLGGYSGLAHLLWIPSAPLRRGSFGRAAAGMQSSRWRTRRAEMISNLDRAYWLTIRTGRCRAPLPSYAPVRAA
jgi:hypothetical protein